MKRSHQLDISELTKIMLLYSLNKLCWCTDDSSMDFVSTDGKAFLKTALVDTKSVLQFVMVTMTHSTAENG